MLSFTRIYTILGVFELLDDFEETMFLIVFCIIILFSFLKINIALVFTKKMKNLIKDRLELEWERELHYKTNELGSEILKIYNIFFPILCAPVFEICSLPIYYLLSSPQNFQIWMLVLGIIGILLLFCHMFCNVFYFNQYEFNNENSLTRTIALTDIFNPIAQISPIIVHIFIASEMNIVVSIMIQILFLIILLYTFLKRHSYFDVKVMHLSGTLIIFKIMFLFLLLFSCLAKNNEYQPVFFIISIIFFYKIAASLTSMHILSIIKDNRCNNRKWINELSGGIIKNIKMDSISQKFLLIYGFLFYYNPEYLDDYLQKIPLEIIGFISNHVRLCTTRECPLNPENLTKYFNLSDDKKSFPFFDNTNTLKKIFKEYTLFLYSAIPMSIISNDLDFYMNYLLLLLIDDEQIFSAIQQIHKLKDSQNLSFYHRCYLDHFLDIIQKYLKKFEETQRQLMVATSNKCLTNFNTKVYIDIENSSLTMTSKMSKYMNNYIKFIEHLMAEKPHLQNVSKLGHDLLKLISKIDALYTKASKTPRIIVLYLEFRQVFWEDDRASISSLTKLYNYMIDLQVLHSNEENKNMQVLDENLFFSDNSCFMHVSGSLESLGKILKVDENTKNAFGYQSVSAMQGQNITFIIPKLIGKNHDSYMRRFLKTGKTDFLFKEQFLFARKCNNDIFKVFLTIKTFFDKSSQMLKFLTHLKPNFLQNDASIILVNEYGYIDSYGGPIKEILEPLFEEYKSHFYIQVLIPQLYQYFDEAVEKHFNKNTEKNWKRKYKTRTNNSLWNNDILNLRIYDKYPSFPQPLDVKEDYDSGNKEKELEIAISYFVKLGNLMKKNYSGCNIYRFECLIEDFHYEGLNFKLFNVQKVRFLYHRNAEEIKKIDSKNVQALFILPKIMIQTGLFRRLISKKSSNNDEVNSCNNILQNQKISDYKSVIEMEKLEHNKQCSVFEIKELLIRDEEKSQFFEHIYQSGGFRHALSSVELGRNEVLDIEKEKEKENENENEKKDPDENNKRDALKRRSKTSAIEKIEKVNGGLDKLGKSNHLLPPDTFEIDGDKKKNPKNDQKNKVLTQSFLPKQRSLLKEDSVLNENSECHNNMIKPKFFTENKRLIYKTDSLDPADMALEDQIGVQLNIKRVGGDKDKQASSNSSVQKENVDRKNDLYYLINKPFIPNCYQYMKYTQVLLVVITLLCFSLLAYFSTDILYKIKDALNRNSFIEMFKAKILDCLMMAQESVIFADPNDVEYLVEKGQELGQQMYSVLNPPFDQINELNFNFLYNTGEEIEMSIISSLFSFVDFLVENPKDNETNQIILSNGLNLFQNVEDITNMMEITSGVISNIQKNLFVLAFLSMAISALLVSLQIINVFAAFAYINGILRIFLSLSINDYKILMEKIVKYKDFKTSLDNSTSLNKTKKINFYTVDTTKIKENAHTSSTKKIIRLVAVQIKIPVLFIMLVGLLLIATFSSFVIAILYESQMLDDSLSTLLMKISTISKTKSYNFQIFIRLTDKQFFNNSYGFSDQENSQLLDSLQNFISYTFNQNNQFPNYNQIMTSNLCSYLQDAYDSNVQECLAVGDGILAQGN